MRGIRTTKRHKSRPAGRNIGKKTRQEKGWKCRETTKPVQETKTMKKIEDQKQKAQKIQNDKKKKVDACHYVYVQNLNGIYITSLGSGGAR